MSESCADCRARKRRREQRQVETPDHAAAAARMVKALGRRAAEDVAAMPELVALGRLVDQALGEAVRAAVAGTGGGPAWSYGDVARALGITRQAVHKRWGTGDTPPA